MKGYGGDYTSICPLIQAGESTSTPHLTWSDLPIPSDVLVMLELAGVRRRYRTPLTRTLYMGKAPEKIRNLAKAIVEGVDVGLELARPGNTCEIVEGAWQAVLNRNSIVKESRAEKFCATLN